MNERSPIQIKVRRFIRRMPQAPEGRFESDEVSEENEGVRRARKTIRWIVFTDERAGRPWRGGTPSLMIRTGGMYAGRTKSR